MRLKTAAPALINGFVRRSIQGQTDTERQSWLNASPLSIAQNLLTFCRLNKGRVHFVVVFNLTRFARDKYDHFALRSHLQPLGISLRSATEPIDDTSTGKLMEGVLAAFAQFDNDVRSDRTRAGMKAALELGRWVFLAPIGYTNAPRSAGRSLLPRRGARADHPQGVRGLLYGALQQAANARTRNGRRPTESTEPAAQLAGHRHAAAQSALRRHHRRARVRRAPQAWRLRADHHRRPVPARPGGAVGSHPEQRAAAPGTSRLSTPQLRPLRVLQSRAYRKLVEGAQRLLRLLPLSARLPRRERDEGEAGDRVHRRTRTAPADRRLHARAQGGSPAALEGAQGSHRDRTGRRRAPRSGHSEEARPAGRGVRTNDIDVYDRHAESPREELTLLRMDRHASEVEDLDVEGVLAFAQRILPRAADPWVQSSLDQRQRFQRLFLPEGIAFDGSALV
ncbi:MAG: recombinase family protein [Acidobacteria bacterium]|nr:recombinase family protein [Acidobacteriota bacterium]